MGKKKQYTFHYYECSISGERFKRTAKAQDPESLVSVESYYELNEEQDDRPEHIKKKMAEIKAQKEQAQSLMQEFADLNEESESSS